MPVRGPETRLRIEKIQQLPTIETDAALVRQPVAIQIDSGREKLAAKRQKFYLVSMIKEIIRAGFESPENEIWTRAAAR
jgi:hypothetical protein